MARIKISKGTAVQSLLTSFIIVVLFFGSIVPAYSQDSLCASLKATGNPEYPPFLWQVDQSTQLHGAVANLMSEVSKRIEIPIETTYVGPWSRSQQEVRSGRVDLMAGAFYTSERADYMEYFTPAMMFTKSVVWQSSASLFNYQMWSDLEGRWGVTVINNSFGQEFDEYAKRNLNLLTVASLEQALSMLNAGRADYVLYEKNPATAYVQKLGFEGLVLPIEPALSSEGLFLTISNMSPCNTPEIKAKISAALRDIVDKGVPEKVLMDALTEWREGPSKL